jgi:hypothetical protein
MGKMSAALSFVLAFRFCPGPDLELGEPGTFGGRGAYLYVEKKKKLPSGQVL